VAIAVVRLTDNSVWMLTYLAFPISSAIAHGGGG
jgi:hypothetical protein